MNKVHTKRILSIAIAAALMCGGGGLSGISVFAEDTNPGDAANQSVTSGQFGGEDQEGQTDDEGQTEGEGQEGQTGGEDQNGQTEGEGQEDQTGGEDQDGQTGGEGQEGQTGGEGQIKGEEDQDGELVLSNKIVSDANSAVKKIDEANNNTIHYDFSNVQVVDDSGVPIDEDLWLTSPNEQGFTVINLVGLDGTTLNESDISVSVDGNELPIRKETEWGFCYIRRTAGQDNFTGIVVGFRDIKGDVVISAKTAAPISYTTRYHILADDSLDDWTWEYSMEGKFNPNVGLSSIESAYPSDFDVPYLSGQRDTFKSRLSKRLFQPYSVKMNGVEVSQNGTLRLNNVFKDENMTFDVYLREITEISFYNGTHGQFGNSNYSQPIGTGALGVQFLPTRENMNSCAYAFDLLDNPGHYTTVGHELLPEDQWDNSQKSGYLDGLHTYESESDHWRVEGWMITSMRDGDLEGHQIGDVLTADELKMMTDSVSGRTYFYGAYSTDVTYKVENGTFAGTAPDTYKIRQGSTFQSGTTEATVWHLAAVPVVNTGVPVYAYTPAVQADAGYRADGGQWYLETEEGRVAIDPAEYMIEGPVTLVYVCAEQTNQGGTETPPTDDPYVPSNPGRPTPRPTPEVIPEEETPLVSLPENAAPEDEVIFDEETPLAPSAPVVAEEEIPDEETPLASPPKTGSSANGAAALLAAAAALTAVLFRRKK